MASALLLLIAAGLSGWMVAAIGLVGLALLIALRAAWTARRGTLSLTRLLRQLATAAWLVPAWVVVTWVAFAAAPTLGVHPADPTDRLSSLEFTTSDGENDLPAWVTAGRVVEQNRLLVVVAGDLRTTPEEARQHSLDRAVAVVQYDFDRSLEPHERAGPWTLPRGTLEEAGAIQLTYQQGLPPRQLSERAAAVELYRVFHQLELSPAIRSHPTIRQTWRTQAVERRLIGLGSIAGMLILVVVTAATWLRLDVVSQGAYRKRLQLAAVSMVLAGGLVVTAMLRQLPT